MLDTEKTILFEFVFNKQAVSSKWTKNYRPENYTKYDKYVDVQNN